MSIERLEVGVDVLRAVLWVDETVESIARHVVAVAIIDLDDRRPGLQTLRQHDPVPLVGAPERPSVQGHERLSAGGIKPDGRVARQYLERDGGATGVLRRACQEVEREVVVHIADPRLAIGRLMAGEHIARWVGHRDQGHDRTAPP